MAERADGSRRAAMTALRESGLTYVEIGRRYGITRERVRQIIKGRTRPPALESRVMLKPGQVAQLLGLHVNTVRRWSEGGVLKAYRITARGDRRFRLEDVLGLLKG